MEMRRHIPIGSLWSMRIEVPYSLIVRDGHLAWTCGQVPLDAQGRVLDPGDLVAQTRRLCGYVRDLVARVDLTPASVCKLVVYYVGDGEMRAAMLSELRAGLREAPIVVPVAVPHFYYEGLMIEADVFASATRLPTRRIERRGVCLESVDAGNLTWVSVHAQSPEHLAKVLDVEGHAADRLLCDHWFIPRNADSRLLAPPADAGFCSDPEAAVRSACAAGPLIGELTFASGPVQQATDVSAEAHCVTRKRGDYLWVSARAVAEGDLVAQTRVIMRAIEKGLTRNGFSFADVVKSTTHYVAGAADEELHSNMAVRNAYYRKPGPASTGIPISGLGSMSSLSAVDIIARKSNG